MEGRAAMELAAGVELSASGSPLPKRYKLGDTDIFHRLASDARASIDVLSDDSDTSEAPLANGFPSTGNEFLDELNIAA